MRTSDENRHLRKIFFWGILALVILFFLCLWQHLHSIPRDVDSRVRRALTSGGFNPGLLSAVDGRDVLLAGKIDENIDRDKLIAAVQSVPGVRQINDNLQIALKTDLQVAPPPAPLKSPYITVSRNTDTVVIDGNLADQAVVDKVVESVKQLVGVNKVDNRLTVGQHIAPAEWMDSLLGLLPNLSELTDASVSAGADGFVISGTVDTPEKRAAVLQKAQQAAGEMAIQNRLKLVEPKRSASLSIRMKNDSLSLSGELPRLADFDRVVAAAGGKFGDGQLVNEISVTEKVSDPGWLDGLLQLMDDLTAVKAGGVDANDNEVTLWGVVDNKDELQKIARRAHTLFGDLSVKNRIGVEPPAKIEAPAPAPVLNTQPEFPFLYFKDDSAELVETSQTLVTKVIMLLKRHPKLRLEINAYTDADGTKSHNLDLSKRRSQDIAKILVEAGIAENRLIPKGYGERQPIATNETEEGKAKNRRIEFKVLE